MWEDGGQEVGAKYLAYSGNVYRIGSRAMSLPFLLLKYYRVSLPCGKSLVHQKRQKRKGF